MTGPVDLETLVRAYVPDGDEWTYALALEILATGRSLWQRSEFDPGHFTASGFVVSPDGSSLLLIHHTKLDRWLQPGGHMEAEDSTVAAAARREVLEETGVGDLHLLGTSLVRIDAHEIPERGREPAHVHIDLGVGFHATSTEIGPLDEVDDAAWVPFDALANYDADDALKRGAHAVMLASG